jgi:DNA-binding transcriptional ArsR family regulator
MGRTGLQEDLFLAIAHPIRRAVLEELRLQERPATQLAARFQVTPSALSQHLKALKQAGLVTERRQGRQRIYSLRPAPLREISEWIDAFSKFWPDKLEALGNHLRRSKT